MACGIQRLRGAARLHVAVRQPWRRPRQLTTSLSVVLYAEGTGELGGVSSMPPEPGEPLADDHYGPAHLLIRRAIAMTTNAPEAAVSFRSPLRLGVRHPRGNDLLDPSRLR